MTEIIERDYRYHEAGHIWLVPELHLMRLPDGTLGLSEAEIRRVHQGIANEICGGLEPLTTDELEFLCDVAEVTLVEAAAQIGLHKSALSKWKQSGAVPRSLTSLALKRWFWFKLFGDRLGAHVVSLDTFSDDRVFLKAARQHALDEHAADPVQLLRAS